MLKLLIFAASALAYNSYCIILMLLAIIASEKYLGLMHLGERVPNHFLYYSEFPYYSDFSSARHYLLWPVYGTRLVTETRLLSVRIILSPGLYLGPGICVGPGFYLKFYGSFRAYDVSCILYFILLLYVQFSNMRVLCGTTASLMSKVAR